MKAINSYGYMTLRAAILSTGHLGTERVNRSKFLFLLFHPTLTNIANWSKCKRIYCKKCMLQIIIDKKRN